MNVRKLVVSSALGLGMGAMAFTGAGMASAAPGVSFDNGTNGTGSVGFGDRSAATGATAIASEGNRALAVNLTSKTGTQAVAQGHNNNVVSIDGVAVTGPNTENNNVVNAFGVTSVGGNARNNNVVTVGGATSWAATPTTTPSSTAADSSPPRARVMLRVPSACRSAVPR